MQLFKRALLSLFPDEIANQNINPASMFVSFISTKEFFSVINRKIVENYKLNLFDVTLDPFEFKTGFGENPQIKAKDNDLYYGYCAAANLNGYRFLNCANISNCMTLVVSIYTKDIFRKYGQDAYVNFLYTTFLLSFVFLARIKIFPHKSKEDNHNRFIETFFHFYEFVCSQTGKKISKEQRENIKKDLLNEIEIFFLLSMMYQKFNTIFLSQETTDKDLYSRIFYEELKGNDKNIINEFIENYEKYSTQTGYSNVESKVLQAILPADILIRYLFLDMDMFLVTENIISKLYNKKTLDQYMASFRKNNDELENFIFYITDYRYFKKNFFEGVQKYIITTLRNEGNNEIDEELDDLMSSIGDDIENLESFKVPERIKKESKIMEKILNFYITLVGGFWIARGDNFFIRLFRKPVIDAITKQYNLFDQKNHKEPRLNLYYYGSLLYNYGKNVFYYKYAHENVRAGKQKFFLPYKSNLKNIYSNICILKLFDETFIATILQDINSKDIRIFVKNKKILSLFKEKFSKEISMLVKKDENEMIDDLYSPLSKLLTEGKLFLTALHKNFTPQDRYHIKENIYNLDFRIAQTLYQGLAKYKIDFKKSYSDSVILGICANCRETISGLLLYIAFLTAEEKKDNKTAKTKKDFKIQIIKKLYITDILNLGLHEEHKKDFIKVIDMLYTQFEEILENRLAIDDNRDFLKISSDNRSAYIGNRNDEEIIKKIAGEDVIRFRGFLKNITYYNKRFLIPK